MMLSFVSKGQTKKGSVSPNKRQLSKQALLFVTLIVFIIGGLYLYYEWNKYQKLASSEAVQLAESLEAVLPIQDISQLAGSSLDIGKPSYSVIKTKLVQLVETTNPIRFAYLMGERNGQLVFLVDSEMPESPDYSPPGQIYVEADAWDWAPFTSGNTVITPQRTDRWGTWINALVPIKEPGSEKTIAIFGLDYSASEWYAAIWKQMVLDITVVIAFLLLYFALLYVLAQQARLNSLNKKLAFDEALYRSVFDQAPIGIAIVNDESFAYQSDYGHTSLNSMFERILGRKRSDLSNVRWAEITHPEDLQADLEKYDQFKKGEINGYTMEKRFIRPDGSSVWVNMTISTVYGVLGNNSVHLCLLNDITARKETENLLREVERRQSVLLSHLPGLAYRCNYDHDWTMQYVSDGCLDLTGYTPDCLLNNRDLSYNDLISQEYREALWNEWKRILPKKQPFKFEYEIMTAAGERKWVLEMGQGIYKDDGEVEALEGIVLDISDRKEMENNLRYINEHDRWTGLYNRDFLENLLENDAMQKVFSKRALISINLSTVQLLTANYGFHYSQNLIKRAAETLSWFCTDKRSLFNTYENRFVFYLVDYKNKEELIEFSQSIADVLEFLFISEKIGGGIGVLEIEQDNELTVDLLLRRLLIASERAMNVSEKDFGICFYDEELEKLVAHEGEIREELNRIATDDDCDELFLLYQPILDLKTDSVCGFEALARLKTEKLGLVSPLEFIPIAEKTKLIIPIGQRIILNALSFLKKLEARGYETISVSINISAIQLFRPDFTYNLFSMINKMQVNPKNIGIELTESIFTSDYDYINTIISELRAVGLHIAIDDFGTGYSSLAREKELNVNCLKIDKFFSA